MAIQWLYLFQKWREKKNYMLHISHYKNGFFFWVLDECFMMT